MAWRRIAQKPDGNDSYHNDNQSASHRLSAPRSANAKLPTQTLHAGAAKGPPPKTKGTTGPNGLSKGAFRDRPMEPATILSVNLGIFPLPQKAAGDVFGNRRFSWTFISGFGVGYAVRDLISRRRHRRAR